MDVTLYAGDIHLALACVNVCKADVEPLMAEQLQALSDKLIQRLVLQLHPEKEQQTND